MWLRRMISILPTAFLPPPRSSIKWIRHLVSHLPNLRPIHLPATTLPNQQHGSESTTESVSLHGRNMTDIARRSGPWANPAFRSGAFAHRSTGCAPAGARPSIAYISHRWCQVTIAPKDRPSSIKRRAPKISICYLSLTSPLAKSRSG